MQPETGEGFFVVVVFSSWSKAFCGKPFGNQAQNFLLCNLNKKPLMALYFTQLLKPTGRWKKIHMNISYVQKGKIRM